MEVQVFLEKCITLLKYEDTEEVDFEGIALKVNKKIVAFLYTLSSLMLAMTLPRN